MSFSENKDCNTLRDDTILKMSVGLQVVLAFSRLCADALIAGKHAENKRPGGCYDENIA